MNTSVFFHKIHINSFYTILIVTLFLASFPLVASAFSLKVGTVNPNKKVPVGTTISFVFDTDVSNLKYTLSDTLPGSTLSNSHIYVNTFSWTPQSQDVGTHVVTTTAQDSVGNRQTVTEEFVITEATGVMVKDVVSASVYPNETVSFSVAAIGFMSPSFNVQDSFPGSSVRNSFIDGFGNFSWKPVSTDVGTHNLQITVTNSLGRREQVFQTVVVKGIKVESVPASVVYGSQVSIPIKVYGMSNISYRVRDTFRGNTIDTAKIENNTFLWIPDIQDVGSHTITITAIDGNSSSDYTFNLAVLPKNIQHTQVLNTTSTPKVTESAVSRTEKKPRFSVDIKPGAKGSLVSDLQRVLTEEKVYSGPINGVFGPQTKKAVQLLQKKNRIPQTGMVGPQTRGVLNK